MMIHSNLKELELKFLTSEEIYECELSWGGVFSKGKVTIDIFCLIIKDAHRDAK